MVYYLYIFTSFAFKLTSKGIYDDRAKKDE